MRKETFRYVLLIMSMLVVRFQRTNFFVFVICDLKDIISARETLNILLFHS